MGEQDRRAGGHHVELLGIVVTIISIDELHRGLGIALLPLPTPTPGEPTRVRPDGLAEGVAWGPMMTAGGSRNGPNADLFEGLPIVPNVIAAMSLVPYAVRELKDLSESYYVPLLQVANPSSHGKALNQCFY
ncbi:MAG: hypothetical protein P8R42_05300 [Candidatus Binatia bacterium]|nr:hypothetical protein [Candidatus Binatia bacterium]